MPVYLVMDDGAYQPDWALIEALDPVDASQKFEAKSEFYKGHVSIVAKVEINNSKDRIE